MSEHQHTMHSGKRPWMLPMLARSPQEAHRVSTPLELFFDLVFVVAVSQNAAGLHHAIAANRVGHGVLHFAVIFFGIWWAWMNFSWFASAFDPDDILYRLTVFVQMTGALILAAGVPFAFNDDNFVLMVLGYTIMRLALVPQWIRAGRSNPGLRKTAYRYAIGVTIVQLIWISWLAMPASMRLAEALVFALVELLVPAWAERAGATPWHPVHIAERYSLFTIIVLGESVLSGAAAIQSVLSEGSVNASIIEIIVGGLLIMFSMWWMYFEHPMEGFLSSMGTAFFWGYGHLLLFASAAAVGAGLAVAVDYATHRTEISRFTAGMAVALPVALYLLGLTVLHYRKLIKMGLPWLLLGVMGSVLIVLTPFTGHAVLLPGLLLLGVLALYQLESLSEKHQTATTP